MGTLKHGRPLAKIAMSQGSFHLLKFPAMGLFVVGVCHHKELVSFFFWLPASYHTPSAGGYSFVCRIADQSRHLFTYQDFIPCSCFIQGIFGIR
jgi:hypothetical protein